MFCCYCVVDFLVIFLCSSGVFFLVGVDFFGWFVLVWLFRVVLLVLLIRLFFFLGWCFSCCFFYCDWLVRGLFGISGRFFWCWICGLIVIWCFVGLFLVVGIWFFFLLLWCCLFFLFCWCVGGCFYVGWVLVLNLLLLVLVI